MTKTFVTEIFARLMYAIIMLALIWFGMLLLGVNPDVDAWDTWLVHPAGIACLLFAGGLMRRLGGH